MIGVVDGLVEGSVVGAVKEGALLTGADMVRKSLRGYLNKERERRCGTNAAARTLRVEGSLSFLRTKYGRPSAPRSTQVVPGSMKAAGMGWT